MVPLQNYAKRSSTRGIGSDVRMAVGREVSRWRWLGGWPRGRGEGPYEVKGAGNRPLPASRSPGSPAVLWVHEIALLRFFISPVPSRGPRGCLGDTRPLYPSFLFPVGISRAADWRIPGPGVGWRPAATWLLRQMGYCRFLSTLSGCLRLTSCTSSPVSTVAMVSAVAAVASFGGPGPRRLKPLWLLYNSPRVYGLISQSPLLLAFRQKSCVDQGSTIFCKNSVIRICPVFSCGRRGSKYGPEV